MQRATPDLAPLTVSRVEQGGRSFTLTPPLILTPTFEPDSCGGLYMADDDALDVHEFATTRADLEHMVRDGLVFLWDTYARAEPDTLSVGARLLRTALRRRMKEENV